jgi:hypothetical protein
MAVRESASGAVHPAVAEADARLTRLDRLTAAALSQYGSVLHLSKVRDTGITSDADASVEGAQVRAATLGLISAVEGLADLAQELQVEAALHMSAQAQPSTDRR